MKKILILFIVALIALGGFDKLHSSNARAITPVEEKQLKVDAQEKARLDHLKELQNPKLIEGKLRSAGSLTTLKGEMKYGSTITDTFLKIPIRGMTLDLKYNFGIGIDLEYVKVVSVLDKIVVLQIPKNRLQLQYIEMNYQESKIIGENKKFLVSQFKPSEVQGLLEQSQQFVVNSIGKDQKYFMLAMNNLKSELEKMLKSYGFNKVMFREI
jgi:hypothetical protein